ncbi:MAG: glycosyltransferase [Solirubrobacteraceae bacterium]
MKIDAAQDVVVILCARNEAARIGETLEALVGALPGAALLVVDDASSDGTAEVAAEMGAEALSAPSRLGKGGAATLGARRALELQGSAGRYLLCDADLGSSAAALVALLEALDDADLAVAAFERRAGGGFGIARGFARWAIRDLCGRQLDAPISGQRALSAQCLDAVLPFAPRFGMEIAMSCDAVRAEMRLVEVVVDLEHRASGRTARGFAHRLKQLSDFLLAYASRRWARAASG